MNPITDTIQFEIHQCYPMAGYISWESFDEDGDETEYRYLYELTSKQSNGRYGMINLTLGNWGTPPEDEVDALDEWVDSANLETELFLTNPYVAGRIEDYDEME